MDSAPTTVLRSILDKHLNQLTEEDIAQVTREDCRKYLKDKGMRRPSWNKSQAIQQVISLKALLEGSDDSAAATLRKVLVSPPPENARPRLNVTSDSADSVKEINCSVGIFGLGDETNPNRKDQLRTPSATNGSGRQMTILYCGKVNVYNDIPPYKAQEILHIAASPVHFPQNDQASGTAAVRYVPRQSQTANDRCPANVAISPTIRTESPANRKVLLQRYHDKRKNRVKLKNMKDMGSYASNLEMYMNHPLELPSSNGQLHRSSTSFPTQAGLIPNLCSRPDNPGKIYKVNEFEDTLWN